MNPGMVTLISQFPNEFELHLRAVLGLPIPAIENYLLGYTIGAWAILMGLTMWLQMQLNPQQPDPTQQMIFNWMPVMFTFMLGSFPVGLVIYWAWSNTLSVIQQSIIMKRHGVEVDLFGNIRDSLPFLKKKTAA